MSTRPSWDETFMKVAKIVAERSTCSRRKVGAVLTQGNYIKATGYNGAPPGEEHCVDGGCPRGLQPHATIPPGANMEDCDWCTDPNPNYPWTCPGHEGIPKDADYNQFPCVAIHAEANAIIRAGAALTEGATLYVTEPPCQQCTNLIKGAGIARVVVD